MADVSGTALENYFLISGRRHRVTLTSSAVTWEDDADPPVHRHLPIKELITVGPCDCCRTKKPKKICTYCLHHITFVESLPAHVQALKLYIAKKSGKYSWTLEEVVLHSSDQSVIKDWLFAIHILLKRLDRPRKLIIYINPHGGKQKAPKVYFRKVAPIFELAGVSTEIVITRHSGHAREHILETDLNLYDGVICVGGDGMVNEIINGVLLRAQQDFEIDINDSKLKLKPPTVKVGAIPAGSTDALVCTTTGENNPVTSALLIVMGAAVKLDVASIHNQDRFVRFSCGFLSYGFFGDNIKASEKYRWMGPARYKWTGWQTFLEHNSYEGEVHIEVEKNSDCDPASRERCKAGCTICKEAKEKLECYSSATSENADIVSIPGKFLSVSCALIPNRCSQSTGGFTPTAHLGDGMMDVILVNECSRINFLKFLTCLAKSDTKNHFAFQFVKFFRTRAFEFIPSVESGSTLNSGSSLKKAGTWQCDGEIFNESSVFVKSHCQLLTFFAYGIEERDDLQTDCLFPCK